MGTPTQAKQIVRSLWVCCIGLALLMLYATHMAFPFFWAIPFTTFRTLLIAAEVFFGITILVTAIGLVTFRRAVQRLHPDSRTRRLAILCFIPPTWFFIHFLTEYGGQLLYGIPVACVLFTDMLLLVLLVIGLTGLIACWLNIADAYGVSSNRNLLKALVVIAAFILAAYNTLFYWAMLYIETAVSNAPAVSGQPPLPTPEQMNFAMG